MKVIAHIHSDFSTKFGIPHQSGRIQELKAEIVFEPEYRNPDAFRGWRNIRTSGSSGNFPRQSGKNGLLR